MARPRSSTALFLGVLAFAMILVVWWTTAMWQHGESLIHAADRLGAGDRSGVAAALGAEQTDLATEGRRRQIMFLSEGAVFLLLLVGAGLLYRSAVRREERIRLLQDRFLTGATHELKTPLATIRLGLETLSREGLPRERREHYRQSVLGELDRLDRGTQNLLAAAGLRSAGPPLRIESGDLVADVREAIQTLGSRSAALGVEMVVQKAPTSLVVRRDPGAVVLILQNLLENALKYSPAGSRVEVIVRCEPGRDANTVYPVLEVVDHGRGLVGREPTEVFEPYWRAPDQAEGGAGLGLHVVKELVVAHGGTVEVLSAGRDQGCCFRVIWGAIPDPAALPSEMASQPAVVG